MQSYKIQLEARNQGLSYREGERSYHFGLARDGKTWFVQFPPTDGQFNVVNLSETDIAVLTSRIQKFLSRIWWLGIWPVSYRVAFCDDGVTKQLVGRVQ